MYKKDYFSASSSLHTSPKPSQCSQDRRLYVPVPPHCLQRLGATILLSFPGLPQITILFSLSSESQCSHFRQNRDATLTGSPNFRSPNGHRVRHNIFPIVSYLISVIAFPFTEDYNRSPSNMAVHEWTSLILFINSLLSVHLAEDFKFFLAVAMVFDRPIVTLQCLQCGPRCPQMSDNRSSDIRLLTSAPPRSCGLWRVR